MYFIRFAWEVQSELLTEERILKQTQRLWVQKRRSRQTYTTQGGCKHVEKVVSLLTPVSLVEDHQTCDRSEQGRGETNKRRDRMLGLAGRDSVNVWG